MEGADFSGYATKAGLKCSDGRTITPQAFQHMNGVQVPLVWQHGHNSPDNILGHAILEARGDGMYAYGFFNETKAGQNAKALVQHKDINQLSIYANQLVEKMKQVLHGMICEVSLVLKGANPGAKIDYVALQHDDGSTTDLEDEAVIYTGLEIVHAASSSDPAAMSGKTVQDVVDSMTPEQQAVLHYMVGAAIEMNNNAAHSDEDGEAAVETDDEPDDSAEGETAAEETTPAEGDLDHKEGSTIVTRNVFDQTGDTSTGGTLQHSMTAADMKGIFDSAASMGSLKRAVEAYALQHGIDNIDVLFPNAQNITGTPDFQKRRTEWVQSVLNGVGHTPFSRIKTLLADITMDEARAKGYIKGTLKKEEFFSVTKRTTAPTTVYKKQKLDRDDVLDIIDFDVVAWMKGEMRLMLEEEIARAILIGDGRAVDDEDKIKDPAGATDGTGVRSILNDHEIYVTTVNVNLDDASSSYVELIDEFLKSRKFYRGTGLPTFYTTNGVVSQMLLVKDTLGRRLYATRAELESALNVAAIVEVESMEAEVATNKLLGILVNLSDYTVGQDRGGEISLFDFFDLDYNQLKYLLETRFCGALTKYKSAIVYKKVAAGAALVVPLAPTFDETTGHITINDTTGVVYKHGVTTVTNGGSPYTVTAGTSWTIDATPASGSYYFESNAEDSWTFTMPA